VADALFLSGSGLYLLGLIVVVVSLAAYITLTIRSIQIRRFGREAVTLKRVAPEFAEAYRVRRRDRGALS
jgi:hypothetical protein